jgi:hypothetical protein
MREYSISRESKTELKEITVYPSKFQVVLEVGEKAR